MAAEMIALTMPPEKVRRAASPIRTLPAANVARVYPGSCAHCARVTYTAALARFESLTLCVVLARRRLRALTRDSWRWMQTRRAPSLIAS